MLPKLDGNDMLPNEAGSVKAGPAFVFFTEATELTNPSTGYLSAWAAVRPKPDHGRSPLP